MEDFTMMSPSPTAIGPTTTIETVDTPKGVTTLPEADAYKHLKDSMGRFRTQSLFVETKNDKYPAPFTLKDTSHKGRVSMYEKYMEIGDPTEYSQAIALLGSWRHWKVLTSTQWFAPYVDRWREELKVKLESERFREMETLAETHHGTQIGVQATKWLSDRYTSGSKKSKRGRPSNLEVENSLNEDKKELELLEVEAQRIGLREVSLHLDKS